MREISSVKIGCRFLFMKELTNKPLKREKLQAKVEWFTMMEVW
jgi:hypothetical protein